MLISVVIPVFNSSKILVDLNTRIQNTMSKFIENNNLELILINDCSQDESWDVIKKLAADNSYIKGINLTENFGQHNAIMAGLNNSMGKKIVTLDDDLQHPPEFINDILKKLDNYEVCYTNYKNRKHVGWKRAVSGINNIISSFLLNKPIAIYMSSFRGIDRKIVNEIIKFKEVNVYIDGLIIKSNARIGMINVEHHERKQGKSNYSFKKLLILWSNMVINFSFLPFRPASIFGISLKILIKLLRKKSDKPQYKILEIV